MKKVLLILPLFLLLTSISWAQNNTLVHCFKMATKEYGEFYFYIQSTTTIDSDINLATFNKQDFFEKMVSFENGIKENIAADILDCALGLNETREKLLSKWYSEALLLALEDSSKMAAKPLYDAIEETHAGQICNSYNAIAVRFQRNGQRERAEDIYRLVLRKYSKFKGCFTEAELSLQGLYQK